MKSVLIFIALVVASVLASPCEPGLTVKFGIGTGIGKDFFISLPLTITEAESKNYVPTPRADGCHLPSLVLYCPPVKKPIVGVLFDNDTGLVAGLQISFPKKDITGFPYDWKVQGFRDWVPYPNEEDPVEYYYTSQYYVSEEYLQKTPEERLAQRDETKFLQENALWVTGFNGGLDKISDKKDDIDKSNFTKQACIPFMGRHYFYNMSKTTQCTSDTILSWFLLLYSEELVASGVAINGKLPVLEDQPDYVERPDVLAVKNILTDGPECQYKMVKDNGQITLHIYFCAKPLLLWNCFSN